MVRTIDSISTKTAKAGDRFEATLHQPLKDGDWIIAPKGSKVIGEVVDADAGGRVKGRATLSLALRSIQTADGEPVAVRTESLSSQAKSSSKKDALKVGIGAGIGAAIGAIAGGGKGAAIGAASGGAAGTGLVLATRGEAAVVPSESLLTFQLAAPVTVTARK